MYVVQNAFMSLPLWSLLALACDPKPAPIPPMPDATQKPTSTAAFTPEPSVAVAPSTTAPTPPLPFKSACVGVSLELSNVRQESGTVAFVATLKNAGPAPVPLMMTGDGSSSSRRNPSLVATLSPNTVTSPGLCGMMNPLGEGDFVTLKVGEARKLAWGHAEIPSVPGTYTLQLTYRNDPNTQQHSESPYLTRIRATTACEVQSNKVQFTWVMGK